MTEVVEVVEPVERGAAHAIEGSAHPCANCGELLRGDYCSRCGQHARDLHRPVGALLSDVVGDLFSLDTRALRTLRPLLFTPGAVTREYLAGRRVAHVPPLRTYLIAALVFFSLFTLFPTRADVSVVIRGSAEAEAARGAGGNRVSFELPERMPIGDAQYQKMSARARANPEAFATAVFRNVPRAFFFLLPMFALLLELFYRKQGYYVDHLVFALYYHAFVFLVFALVFLVGRSGVWLPGLVTLPVRLGLTLWLFAYLPLALRRVYGGSRSMTAVKVMGLGVLYLAVFFVAMLAMMTVALVSI